MDRQECDEEAALRPARPAAPEPAGRSRLRPQLAFLFATGLCAFAAGARLKRSGVALPELATSLLLERGAASEGSNHSHSTAYADDADDFGGAASSGRVRSNRSKSKGKSYDDDGIVYCDYHDYLQEPPIDCVPNPGTIHDCEWCKINCLSDDTRNDDKLSLPTCKYCGHACDTPYTYTPSTGPTGVPTVGPSGGPTYAPSAYPSPRPTRRPTDAPSYEPSACPSPNPTRRPTRLPTSSPSGGPSEAPTYAPTLYPTPLPTRRPTKLPTSSPTALPYPAPTSGPTLAPTLYPTALPLMPA